MDAACSTHEEKVDVCRIFVGKLEVERLIGRTRRRWEDKFRCILEKSDWVVCS